MNAMWSKFNQYIGQSSAFGAAASAPAAFWRSFSPAGQAVLCFAAPFTLLDALHYYSAGTALLLSFPLVLSAYLLCGALAA